MFDLTGRVALVTGGSKGLGREMATALAASGADVMICSRQKEEVEQTASEIAAETGRRVLGAVADMTQRADIDTLVEQTLGAFGKLDILVNNAGSGLRRPILKMSDEDWEKIISVCLTGPFMMARAVAPTMVQAGYGRIINISSSLGSIALPDRSAYCSAKGGLMQLTRVMALEWATHGITVNTICPGPFRTAPNLRMLQNPALYEAYLNLIPQHRWAEPSEIRGAVVYLASEEASFVTGSALYLDGGWTAHAGLPPAGAAELDAGR